MLNMICCTTYNFLGTVTSLNAKSNNLGGIMLRHVARKGYLLRGRQKRALSTKVSYSVDEDTGIVSSRTDGTPTFQTVIGLEIHAQLSISTKLFSGCPITQSSSLLRPPNTSVWPLDVGTPGYLPLLSRQAVHAAVLSAAATNCSIEKVSRFERKHYFYADLPLGYQVTQQRWPIARNGFIRCTRGESKMKKKKGKPSSTSEEFEVRIERIQLEQDTGKTTVASGSSSDFQESFVDFNRAGSALIEIVFSPDLRSSRDAATTVETLRNLFRYIGTCDGKMEEGSLRCDLNISIAATEHTDDATRNNDIVQLTGHRVEVKNLNSLRQVVQAANFESIRQAESFVAGMPAAQETRTFDVKTGKTVLLRKKEGETDYRFMPEPDIPPVVLDEEAFGELSLEGFVETSLPELPDKARLRLMKDYGLSEYVSSVLVHDTTAIRVFEESLDCATDQTRKSLPTVVANLICNEVFAYLRSKNGDASKDDGYSELSTKSVITGSQIGQLGVMLVKEDISSTMAKQILAILFEAGDEKSPLEVASERGFKLVTDMGDLKDICRPAILGHPEELERYKLGGKYARKLTKFFVGKAMAASKGNAHPERLADAVREALDEIAPGVEK